IGIFFMALTLVIVSFSCTGPILGSLLGSAVTGSTNVPMLLTFALAGFGLAWAIVFGLLALFPQALQSLPKSGGWMNTVKVVLGFVELALALKFLSKADLVSKTFLLKRELFIGIWIVIALGLALYLFG
ncbi:protein-disulfide reductase, partial [Chryseobacterium arthrosphaerae]